MNTKCASSAMAIILATALTMQPYAICSENNTTSTSSSWDKWKIGAGVAGLAVVCYSIWYYKHKNNSSRKSSARPPSRKNSLSGSSSGTVSGNLNSALNATGFKAVQTALNSSAAPRLPEVSSTTVDAQAAPSINRTEHDSALGSPTASTPAADAAERKSTNLEQVD